MSGSRAALIDLHCHILPGLDDGPETLEQSVAMLRVAAAAGTSDLVASPHANFEFPFDPDTVCRKIQELAAAAATPVRLHRGCDFHLQYDNIQDALANPSKYTIDGGPYLLVEFSELLIVRSTDEVFERFRQAGIVPIITHPERNFLLHRRSARLRSWVEAGCLVQVTAQSLLGRFGPEARRAAHRLVEQGLVHVVASDAHDAEDRPPRLDLAHQRLSRKYGQGWADLLCRVNPAAVLAGQPLPEQPPPPRPARWWRWGK